MPVIAEKMVGKCLVFTHADPYARGVLTASNFNELVKQYPDLKLYGYLFFKDASELALDIPGLNKVVKHPVTGNSTSIYNIIINLNDHHEWTREQIADWLDTLDDPPRFV